MIGSETREKLKAALDNHGIAEEIADTSALLAATQTGYEEPLTVQQYKEELETNLDKYRDLVITQVQEEEISAPEAVKILDEINDTMYETLEEQIEIYDYDIEEELKTFENVSGLVLSFMYGEEIGEKVESYKK